MEGDVGKFTAKRDAKRIPTTTQPTARDVLCDLRVLWQSPRIAVPKGLEPLRRANKRSYRMTAFNRLANDFQSRASSSSKYNQFHNSYPFNAIRSMLAVQNVVIVASHHPALDKAGRAP